MSSGAEIFISKFFKVLPRHLQSSLHAVDGLFKVPEEFVDIAQLTVGRCRGNGVVEIVADYQPFLEANLKQDFLAEIFSASAVQIGKRFITVSCCVLSG